MVITCAVLAWLLALTAACSASGCYGLWLLWLTARGQGLVTAQACCAHLRMLLCHGSVLLCSPAMPSMPAVQTGAPAGSTVLLCWLVKSTTAHQLLHYRPSCRRRASCRSTWRRHSGGRRRRWRQLRWTSAWCCRRSRRSRPRRCARRRCGGRGGRAEEQGGQELSSRVAELSRTSWLAPGTLWGQHP